MLGSYGIVSLFVFLLVLVCIGGFGVSVMVDLARRLGRDFWFFDFVI